MQLPHQLWRQRGGQLVGDPGGEVALGVAVGDVAEVAAAGVRGRWGHHEACKSILEKKAFYARRFFLYCAELHHVSYVYIDCSFPSSPNSSDFKTFSSILEPRPTDS